MNFWRELEHYADISNTEIVKIGPIEVDARKHTVTVGGMSLTLRQKEFVLLELLMTHLGTVFSKTQIAERVWGSAYYVSDNTIEATISTLRQKLSDIFEDLDDYKLRKNDQIIETIRGAGYRFNFDLFKNYKE